MNTPAPRFPKFTLGAAVAVAGVALTAVGILAYSPSRLFQSVSEWLDVFRNLYWVPLLVAIAVLAIRLAIEQRRARNPASANVAKGPTEYKSLTDTHQVFDEVIEEFAKTPGTKEIRVIAATGASLIPIIRRLISSPHTANITFRFLFADPDSAETARAAAHWHDEVNIVLGQLPGLNDESRRIRFEWKFYRHLPTMHGIRFENESLLLGFFRWTHRNGRSELAGAERPYLYVRKGEPLADVFFELFDGWFAEGWKEGASG